MIKYLHQKGKFCVKKVKENILTKTKFGLHKLKKLLVKVDMVLKLESESNNGQEQLFLMEHLRINK